MTLILIRGLPGSGKSTMARQYHALHLEADMYHVKDGKYLFDGSKTKLSHEWCQKTCFDAMDNGMDVVVSNTFTQKWEMQPYFDYAKKTGHELVVITTTGAYGSIHGVPAEVVEKMSKRWEEL